MTNPKSPWDLDVRVRERNLKKGILDPKEMEKYLKDLPDVAAQAEAVSAKHPGVDADADGE